jgi:hypothetical protein
VRTKTIPSAVVDGSVSISDDDKGKGEANADFSISDEQWTETEKAYGHKLDAATRDEVLRVTTLLVLFEPFERKAAPLAEAETRVQEIKGSAERFFRDLFGGPRDDATAFADELIDRHFNRRMPQLPVLLGSLAAACNSALTEMKTSPSHSREGAAWDQWVSALTTILSAAKLRTAASKGRGKPGSVWPSAFVSLLLKLQSYVPKEARRHETPDGLASAIALARKGRGSKPEGPATKK